MFRKFSTLKAKAVPTLAKGARTGHLIYYAGVFIEGHGFYIYAALGLAIVEATLWIVGHGEE